MYEYEKYSIIIDFFCVIDPPFYFIVVVCKGKKYVVLHHRMEMFKGPPKSVSLFFKFSKRESRDGLRISSNSISS